MVWSRNATVLRESGAPGAAVFRTDRKLSFLYGVSGGSVSLETDSGEASAIAVKLEKKPSDVILDGSPVKFSYDRNSGMVNLTLPGGRHMLSLKQ